jgi:hypothetical protein
MKSFWRVFLKVAVWGLGHQDAVKQIVTDAKAKKVAVVEDEVEAAVENINNG